MFVYFIQYIIKIHMIYWDWSLYTLLKWIGVYLLIVWLSSLPVAKSVIDLVLNNANQWGYSYTNGIVERVKEKNNCMTFFLIHEVA